MRVLFQVLVCVAGAAATLAQPATKTDKAANILANASGSYVLDDKHILAPGDRLSFRIIEDKDPARSLTVTDSHELDVPYIGRVSIANETCKQVAGQLKTLLEAKYYYHATVIVGLDSVNKLRGKVYVQGQVRAQGPVDLLFEQKLTAGKAILVAGGFADFANKRKVKVVRASEGPGVATKTFEINMVDVLENGQTDKDILLEPNDYIIVPARLVNF
jgi:protein involved in polysaccharide export with SLBB domain